MNLPPLTHTPSSPWSRLQHHTLANFTAVGWAYVLVTVIATATQYLPAPHMLNGFEVTWYNNYVIFKQSFFHLLDGKNLYIAYPAEHHDLYKYTPTFSLFFGLFAFLPDALGLLLWNALNVGVFFYGFSRLPFLSTTVKAGALWLMIPEMMTTTQNCQSNALMAGLILCCFNALESGRSLTGAFNIAAGFFVKLFALVGGALFLLYPGKVRTGVYLAACFAILFALPLLVASPSAYLQQFANYREMLAMDASASHGMGVEGMLTTWFSIDAPKNAVLAAGVVIFLLPFARVRMYQNASFKLLALASILLWCVIFNHKSESPTFIIAVAGVSIWYFLRPRAWFDLVLGLLVVIFTSLSPTDLFPSYVFHNWVVPYVLKGAFCVFVWFRLVYEMMTMGGSEQ